MKIFPAIDLFEGCAVRLKKGDYDQKTIYSNEPLKVAYDFMEAGALQIHVVDLEGARSGETPNFDIIKEIKEKTGLFVEVGGGIRSIDTIRKYTESGIDRVILGTKAVSDPDFVDEAIELFGNKVAIGIDIKDGYVAVKGWTENSDIDAFDFMGMMLQKNVTTVICTDISKDGMMQGPNMELYKNIHENFPGINLIASGGVSDIANIKALKEMGLYGAILGKAYYEKAVDLKEAIQVA